MLPRGSLRSSVVVCHSHRLFNPEKLVAGLACEMSDAEENICCTGGVQQSTEHPLYSPSLFCKAVSSDSCSSQYSGKKSLGIVAPKNAAQDVSAAFELRVHSFRHSLITVSRQTAGPEQSTDVWGDGEGIHDEASTDSIQGFYRHSSTCDGDRVCSTDSTW